MKIAIFSDIHANLYAFSAALDDAQSQGATDFIFLGDTITDLPWANEVYDIIRGLDNVKIIRGNRERYLLEFTNHINLTELKQFSSIAWTCSILSDENKAYISNMQDRVSFCLHETDFFLDHRPEDIWSAETSEKLHYYASSTETHEDYTKIMRSGINGNWDITKNSKGIYLYGHFHGQWHGSYEERLIKYDIEKMLFSFRHSELYKTSFIFSETIATCIETGLENYHMLFTHLDTVCKSLNMGTSFYPNEVWETEGLNWLKNYRKKLGLSLDMFL